MNTEKPHIILGESERLSLTFLKQNFNRMKPKCLIHTSSIKENVKA